MKVKTHTVARWFSLGWALAATVYLLVAPTYSTASSSSSTSSLSSGATTFGSATLLEVNGGRVLLVLAVPICAALLSLVPVRDPVRRWLTGVAASIATAFSVVGAMSVGLFFVPTAIGLIVATATDGSTSVPAT